MLHVVEHTLLDVIKLIPFLFLTYLLMEYMEHKTKEKTKKMIKKAGKFGPFIGAVAGAFPQCGFSAAAAGLYAGRVISIGSLIAIFLSTSDEMIPILISKSVEARIIFQILGMKLLIGMVAGFLLDLIFSSKQNEQHHIHELCEHDHCHCEEGNILKSSFYHTVKITVFLLLISFVLNIVMHYMGEDTLSKLILNRPLYGEIISGFIGLIPNCAASVIITQLYIEGAMSFGAMMSGLLVSAGVGILILFKVNHDKKDSLKIIGILYFISIISGLIIEFFGIHPM